MQKRTWMLRGSGCCIFLVGPADQQRRIDSLLPCVPILCRKIIANAARDYLVVSMQARYPISSAYIITRHLRLTGKGKEDATRLPLRHATTLLPHAYVLSLPSSLRPLIAAHFEGEILYDYSNVYFSGKRGNAAASLL
jgi:hypothetical protein